MLLLRAALASALLVQGASYFGDSDVGAGALAIGVISIAAAALILVGMLTPVAGIVVALSGIGIAFSLLPSCTRPLFGSGIPLLFAISILLAIMILGPGAFSVDARLFGQREIIIPRRSDSMEHGASQ